MISRLSLLAAVFAVVTTASLAYAANVQHRAAETAAIEAMPVVYLPQVTVTGKREAPSL